MNINFHCNHTYEYAYVCIGCYAYSCKALGLYVKGFNGQGLIDRALMDMAVRLMSACLWLNGRAVRLLWVGLYGLKGLRANYK